MPRNLDMIWVKVKIMEKQGRNFAPQRKKNRGMQDSDSEGINEK
jgi:hypothetical protein